jgi:hypothetical protein
MNVDAAYPRWCSDIVEVQFPPATGTFASELSQKIVRTTTGGWDLNGLTWILQNFATDPLVATWDVAVNVTWDNAHPTLKRVVRAVLRGHFPLVLAPVTVAQWATRYPPDHRLDQFNIGVVFLHDPTAYNPSTDLFVRAPNWGE